MRGKAETICVHREEKQWFAEDQPTFDLGAVDVSRADVELKAFGTPCVFGWRLMLGALIYPRVRGTQSCQSVASTPNRGPTTKRGGRQGRYHLGPRRCDQGPHSGHRTRWCHTSRAARSGRGPGTGGGNVGG